MSDGLRSCPFCGGEVFIAESRGYDGGCVENLACVECCDCGAGGSLIGEYASREEVRNMAIDAWNRRANDCDRDELLKVADEINADAENIAGYLDSCEGSFSKSDADEYYKFAGWVDRIRKALGVES